MEIEKVGVIGGGQMGGGIAEVCAKAGVDVILSPTLSHANMVEKMRYWRMANPDHSSGAVIGETLADEPHPFVSTEAVARYNQILLSCYEAQLAWRTGS